MEKISSEIQVVVHPKFQPRMRGLDISEHIFSYEVQISNNSKSPIQLIARHWEIYDAGGEHKTVRGAGVVGLQPIIEPGETYTYQSAVGILGELGSMSGYYLMEDLNAGDTIRVEIPKFILTLPYKLN